MVVESFVSRGMKRAISFQEEFCGIHTEGERKEGNQERMRPRGGWDEKTEEGNVRLGSRSGR